MKSKFFFLLFLICFTSFYSAIAQIDSTKRSLYLKCANEILIHYPKDIDTTKITFEYEKGRLYQIISVSKIVLIPMSINSTLRVLYNGKELFSRKYGTKLVPAPEIKCILTKDKFPRRLRIDIEPDENFLKNCPLDARYQITYTAHLVNDKEIVIRELFTDKKQQISQQEWFEIRELFKQSPNAKWRIYVEENSKERVNFRDKLNIFLALLFITIITL